MSLISENTKPEIFIFNLGPVIVYKKTETDILII